MSLRFHWMLPKSGEVVPGRKQTPAEALRYRVESTGRSSPARVPRLDGWTHFARHAEDAGIDSVLISFSRYEPDNIAIATALGLATERLRYMLAYRSGLMQPTTFVQQINTLSAMIGGRLSLNIVAGSSGPEQRGYGDFLAHDERYARADEFLQICRAFWREEGDVDFKGRYYNVESGRLGTPFVAQGRREPEIYISGHSEQSEQLARAHGSCWLRVVDTPEKLAPSVATMRAADINVCLRLCILCRPTRHEALRALEDLLADDKIGRRERAALRDSQLHTNLTKDSSQMHAEASARAGTGAHWLNDSLFTGFVGHYGPVWTLLVGSPRELADTFLAYRRIGVTEFILSGMPELDEVDRFGREVLPLVREGETLAERSRDRETSAAASS